MSSRKVGRRLQQHRLSNRRLWLRVHLTLHHRKRAFNGVFNDKPGCRSGVMPSIQKNLDSIYIRVLYLSIPPRDHLVNEDVRADYMHIRLTMNWKHQFAMLKLSENAKNKRNS